MNGIFAGHIYHHVRKNQGVVGILNQAADGKGRRRRDEVLSSDIALSTHRLSKWSELNIDGAAGSALLFRAVIETRGLKRIVVRCDRK